MEKIEIFFLAFVGIQIVDANFPRKTGGEPWLNSDKELIYLSTVS